MDERFIKMDERFIEINERFEALVKAIEMHMKASTQQARRNLEETITFSPFIRAFLHKSSNSQ